MIERREDLFKSPEDKKRRGAVERIAKVEHLLLPFRTALRGVPGPVLFSTGANDTDNPVDIIENRGLMRCVWTASFLENTIRLIAGD